MVEKRVIYMLFLLPGGVEYTTLFLATKERVDLSDGIPFSMRFTTALPFLSVSTTSRFSEHAVPSGD